MSSVIMTFKKIHTGEIILFSTRHTEISDCSAREEDFSEQHLCVTQFVCRAVEEAIVSS